MARRKKKSARRGQPRREARPAAPTASPASTAEDAPTIERLQALSALLRAGRTAEATSAVDEWLAALGAPQATGPEVAVHQPPDDPQDTADPAEQSNSTPAGPASTAGQSSDDAATPEEAPATTTRPDAQIPASDQPVDAVAAGLLQPLDVPGPRFSVLMAAYNRSHLIGEAIDSVLAQDFADYELVIVDDGSTDATPEVVRGYAAAEPRIRYIQKPHNEGRSPTRSRAVAEARGAFVLWMADDDILAPDLLATYDRVLRENPHVDIVYGKLQLFEGERDLDVYVPNDWTGRERRLLGAELHGSCIPDGGTATRRALYAKVGVPIYDPEFARAQDYELWTRLLPHARVQMVDAVVYRYRKHDGGTSWGPFVDLSFDSKIIRRHLARHALEDLFVQLDWSDPAGARRAAMMRIGRLMLEYQDPHSAERYLSAVAAADVDPDVVEPRVKGRLMAGDHVGAGALIEGFAEGWPLPHPLVERLRAMRRDLVELLRDGRAALAAGRPSVAEQRAVEIQNRHGLSHTVCLLRGLAREAGGDRREGLWYLCQAARLSVDDAESAERALALAAELGIDGPKVDLSAMRRRLTETFYTPESDPAPPAGATTFDVIVIADGGPHDDVVRALESVFRQRRAAERIVLVGAASDDPRVTVIPSDTTPAARRAAGLEATTADAVAWLTADSAWTAEHLARLGAALDGGAPAAWSNGHGRDPQTGETVFDPAIGDARQRLLADPVVPLSALAHRCAVAPAFVAHEDPAHTDWIYALDLACGLDREQTLARIGAPTRVGPSPPSPDPDDAQARRALERVFGRHPTRLLFDAQARARQAERLRPFGVDWPLRGRTGVVIIGGARTDVESTLAAVEAHTRCPHGVVVVADGPSEADRLALVERCEKHALVTTPRAMGPAKTFDLGLARAGGDRVAILRAGVTPPDGWLGRMRGFLADDQQHEQGTLGLALPAAEGPVQRPDDRCLLVTRAVLDAIGGADVGLDPALWLDDWLLRLRQAGFGWRSTDVAFADRIVRHATPADPDAAPYFRARWGALPIGDRLPDTPRADGPLRIPYGAEEGFRFDIPPVEVHDGEGGPRLLIPTGLGAPADRPALTALLAELPPAVRVWLRVSPGAGRAAAKALGTIEPAAHVWLVDAELAPDREGGLFTAADAVYVPDGPDAALHVRRAFDCGHIPLRDAAAVRRWAEASR